VPRHRNTLTPPQIALTFHKPATAWYYEGGTLGYRVVHFYFPRSGIIIAVATNSSTALGASDDLQATAIAVYQTLETAGAVPAS
jgi:D-alanyl-D-alanine carboxypeptidase